MLEVCIFYPSCAAHLIDLMQVWQSLGTLRPAALRDIETKIWEALFDIATLKGTNSRQILTVLSKNINDLLQKPEYQLQPDWFGMTGEHCKHFLRRKHGA